VRGTLVTGGSGFVAGHVVLQLLDGGYAVRTTEQYRVNTLV